jgi:hypothetical protein
MTGKRDRRDGAKPTFAELDKMRRERRDGRADGGGSGGGAGGGPRGAGEAMAQKSYRAALERAFAEGKVDELAATLARRNETPRVMPQLPTALPAPPAAAAADGDGVSATAAPAEATAPAPPPRDPEREARRKAIEQIMIAEGRDSVTKAVDKWLSKFGPLPNDYEVLGKALAHRADAVLLQVMDQIEGCLAKQKPRRSRTLSAHLRLLEDTHDDNAIRDRAARLRSSI